MQSRQEQGIPAVGCTRGAAYQHVRYAALQEQSLQPIKDARIALPAKRAKHQSPKLSRYFGFLNHSPPDASHARMVVLLQQQLPSIWIIPAHVHSFHIGLFAEILPPTIALDRSD